GARSPAPGASATFPLGSSRRLVLPARVAGERGAAPGSEPGARPTARAGGLGQRRERLGLGVDATGPPAARLRRRSLATGAAVGFGRSLVARRPAAAGPGRSRV